MSETYTLGIWLTKPGLEQTFKDAWSEFARATSKQCEGAISAVLLEDAANPRRFISSGPWRSEADIAAWRASALFAENVARIKPMLESFEPGMFTPVCKIE